MITNIGQVPNRHLYPRQLINTPTVVQIMATHVDFKKRKSMGNISTDQLKNESAAKEILHKLDLQGIQQFKQAKSIAGRIFWILVFLLAICLLVNGIRKNIKDYYESPISTTYTITTPSSLDFPDVYICMGTALSRKYILAHREKALGVSFLYQNLLTIDLDMKQQEERKRRKRSSDDQTDQTLDILEDRSERSSGLDEVDFYQFFQEGGFQIPDTFYRCKFTGYDNTYYNCSDIIRGVIDPNYFLCYVVDIPDEMKQVKAGKGLSIIMNSQISDYPRNENDTDPPQNVGVSVSISDRYDPTNWYKTMIKPGQYVKMDLEGTEVQLINTERGNIHQPCETDGTQKYTIFNASYSRTMCQMDCLWGAIRNICECILILEKTLVKDEIIHTTPFCSFNRSQECVVKQIMLKKNVKEQIEECKNQCFPPCNSIRYRMRTSVAYLTDAVTNDLERHEGLNISTPAKELVRIDVAFNRMEFKHLIQSESKTFAQTVADLGGTMNLWLGASLIMLIGVTVKVIGAILYSIMKRCCPGDLNPNMNEVL